MPLLHMMLLSAVLLLTPVWDELSRIDFKQDATAWTSILIGFVWFAGIALFYLRKSQLIIYGVLEATVATTVVAAEFRAAISSGQFPENAQLFGIKLIGVIYFTVRGLCNISDGIEKLEPRSTQSDCSTK